MIGNVLSVLGIKTNQGIESMVSNEVIQTPINQGLFVVKPTQISMIVTEEIISIPTHVNTPVIKTIEPTVESQTYYIKDIQIQYVAIQDEVSNESNYIDNTNNDYIDVFCSESIPSGSNIYIQGYKLSFVCNVGDSPFMVALDGTYWIAHVTNQPLTSNGDYLEAIIKYPIN